MPGRDEVIANRRRFLDAIRGMDLRGRGPLQALAEDQVTFRGGVLIQRVWRDGRVEVVVEDPNLIVTTGRRVMSRIISGAASSPTLARGVRPAIRIIRSTANVEGTGNAPTDAWVRFYQEAGTANFHFELWGKHAGGEVKEFEGIYVGGAKTLSQLVSDINSQESGRWYAEILNSLGAVDFTNLLPTHSTGKTFALGDQASYGGGFSTSPYQRVLYALSSHTPAVVLNDLQVTRLRLGTEGHKPDDLLVGKDVLASDEWLSAALRASDLGEALPADDYISVTVTYPNTAQVAFTGTLDQSSANGRYISEAGLFSTGDHMVARKNFGQIAKTNLFALEVTWTLIF